jgi:hypothetical protein
MATPKKTTTGRWWIQIEVAGQRESATFDTKAQATIWAAQRSTELRQTKKSGLGKTKTLADALARYSEEISPTKKGARAEQIRLTSFTGPDHAPLPIAKKIAAITPEDLGAWRDARLLRVLPGSVLREMTTLATVFEAARREWRWIDSNPVRDVRRPAQPKHREKTLSNSEIRAMLRALRAMVKGIDMTPALKADIEYFENELRNVLKNQSKSKNENKIFKMVRHERHFFLIKLDMFSKDYDKL